MSHSHPYLAAAADEFQSYKRMAEKAVAQINDAQLHTPLDANTNSVAIIMKHMAGNMVSRWTSFLTTDGEKPNRDRDNEFVDDIRSRAELLQRWEAGWALAFSTLANLQPADLDKTVHVRWEPLTVYRAIQRQLAHASYHVGQITILCRHFAGERWQVLTIPRGGSKAFLEQMRQKNLSRVVEKRSNP